MLWFVAEPQVRSGVSPIYGHQPVDPVDSPESARQRLHMSRTAARAIASKHHWILLDSEHFSPHLCWFLTTMGQF